jgi:two-component system phosphate regulon sensor histidine kinase PhoR
MLENIVEQAQLLAIGKNMTISLDMPEDCRFTGNEQELYAAFSNLVFNAVRYTQRGGQVRVVWREWRTTRGLEVIDNGPGIAPEHLPRLTERFYRVDVGRSREQGGTGLGLAIVKHVLGRHNGELKIVSNPGEGSRFRCVFAREDSPGPYLRF